MQTSAYTSVFQICYLYKTLLRLILIKICLKTHDTVGHLMYTLIYM